MNCGILYEGFFLTNQIESGLEHTLKYQHVLTDFLPEDTHNALWGVKATLSFLGYGNNGHNEGYLVSISTDNPVLNEILEKKKTTEAGLFLTVGLSKDGKEEDTRKLDFEPIHVMEPVEVTFGGYNDNMKMPLFVRRDTEVYVEPRYSFHGTGDELFEQALRGKFGDIAQIHRLREILYNEQKYKKASIVGFVRDGMYERMHYPNEEFNLNQMKVNIYRDGYCDTGKLKYKKGQTIELRFSPGEDGVKITIEDKEKDVTASTTYPLHIFNAKDRNSFDLEISHIVHDVELMVGDEYEAPEALEEEK